MMKTSCFNIAATAVIIMLILLSGCMGRSQPARFYTLSSIEESGMMSADSFSGSDFAIGLGPVKLADYLNQSRIITRQGQNRIVQAEFDQWTGSLKDNLTNVLAENISLLLGTDRVSIFPWRSYMPIDYQIPVDIVRFDGLAGGDVTLIARWSVLGGGEKKVFAMERSDIHEKVDRGGYESLVAAQSRAMARLSQDIAQAIKAADHEQGMRK